MRSLERFARRAIAPAALAVLSVLLLAPAALATSPDFTLYQALLNQYCIKVSAKGQPLETRFDYAQLYLDEGIYRAHASARLQAIHDQLLAVPPSQMTPAERQAWGINTFNFLVLERATLHLLVPDRKFLRVKSVNHIMADAFGFMQAPVAVVDGETYTLQRFARRYVFADSGEATEPRAACDPRVAYTLCRGMLGDPPLQPRAYRADSLQIQLDQAVRNAFALPRFVAWEERTRMLSGSTYFNEHRMDYGNNPNGAIALVDQYGPGPVRKGIHKFNVTAFSVFQRVNEDLNIFERPKAQALGKPEGD